MSKAYLCQGRKHWKHSQTNKYFDLKQTTGGHTQYTISATTKKAYATEMHMQFVYTTEHGIESNQIKTQENQCLESWH
jgi:hypothetical protein